MTKQFDVIIIGGGATGAGVARDCSLRGIRALLLERGDIAGVGRLLNASHESSKTLFENSCEELDYLVDTVSGVEGVYGARLTGGGFGGAVMAFTDDTFSQTQANEVAQIYEKKFGKKPMIFACASGDGAKTA